MRDVDQLRDAYWRETRPATLDERVSFEEFVRALVWNELQQQCAPRVDSTSKGYVEPSIVDLRAAFDQAQIECGTRANELALEKKRADEAEATCAAVIQEFQALVELLRRGSVSGAIREWSDRNTSEALKTAGRKLLESHHALREERDKLSSQLESQHSRSMTLADHLRELREAALGLLDSLPRCTFCNEIALRAFQRGEDRYCDEHGTNHDKLLKDAPEYPRAPWVRKLRELLK